MTPTVLLVVIAIQVALFQFGSIAFSRSVFAMHFGGSTASPADRVRHYLTTSARLQVVIGAILTAALVCIATGVLDALTVRRLALAIVSLVSSGVFVVSFVRDRRTLRTLQEALPETGVRRAALEMRQPARKQLFEILTLAMFLVTCLFVFWAVRHVPAPHDPAAGPGPEASRMLVYLAIQGGVTALLLWFSFRLSEARTTASPRFPMFRDHPDVALRVGMELADAEVRAFDWAKIGIASWFACVQLHLFLSANENAWSGAAHAAQWACVGFLLVVFGTYLLRVRRVVTTRVEATENEMG